MIAEILNYRVLEEIFRSADTLVYRARHVDTKSPAIIKVARPSRKNRARWLQREHEFLSELADLDGVINTLQLSKFSGGWAMVLEDIGGTSLAQVIREKPLPVGDFLTLAVRIVGIIAQLHTAGVIHKDINPSNIVMNRGTGKLRLIDFGIATRLPREALRFEGPGAIQGTLAYISPEQTGRMNRPVDFRTDLYSLGATFYHLLTGHPPFSVSDPVALVHAHIARVPRPLRELAPHVPEMLSAVIERLMTKTPEDRYQSAEGLRVDLKDCLRRHRIGDTRPFELDRHHTPTRLTLPDRLYGREGEVAQLLQAFERADDAAEVVLVAGYSGVGKSALVHELYRPITARRGFFVSGKFDQLQRDVPYAVVIQALHALTGQLLSEPESTLRRWKRHILAALGVNSAVLLDVIPDLEHVIGPQPPAPELSSSETRTRLHRVFTDFIGVFARADHPLTLFLDDLQWVDPGSLRLLESVLKDGEVSHLLVIGAYRDNEVAAGHPLLLSMDRLARESVPVSTITLAPLGRDGVEQFVADTVGQSPEQVHALSQLVLDKTGGNPFFMHQLLEELYVERLLTIVGGTWIWDTDAIQARQISNNVVDLVAARMRSLDDDLQAMLQVAGALGSQFDLATLAIVRDENPMQIWSTLWPALEAGLLIALGDVDNADLDIPLRFAHDRIQQATYLLLDEEARVEGHWQIGQRLLAAWPEDAPNAQLFEIVGHLNAGRSQATDQDARDELAELNLRAARRARASAAFAAAHELARIGVELLGDDGTERRYKLAMGLLNECVETAYQTSDFDGMERWYQQAAEAARTVLDTAWIDQIKTEAFNALGRPLDALAHTLQYLKKLGIELPEEPDYDDVVAEMTAAAELLVGRTVDDLAAAPDIEDPAIRTAVELICKVYSSAYVASPFIFAVLTLRQFRLVVEHGNCAVSGLSYAVYGLLMAGLANDVETAYQYGALSSRMWDRPGIKRFEAQARHLFSCHTRMWKEHLRACADGEREAYRVGLETGEMEFGAYGGHVASKYALFHGDDLAPLRAEMAQYTAAMRRDRQDIALNSHLPWHQAATNLIDGAPEPHRLAGELFDIHAARPGLEAVNNRMAISNAITAELILAFLFERFDDAVAAGTEGAGFLDAVLSQFNQPIHLFFDAMARLALWDTTPHADRPTQRETIDAAVATLSGWATSASVNLEQKVTLLRAELLRIDGDPTGARELYDVAIEQSRSNDFLLDEAVAYATAARFYLGRGRERSAGHYLFDARDAYARWGADALVNDLEARHTTLLPMAAAPMDTVASLKTGTIATSVHGTLDLTTLLRAAKAISGEVVLSRLLERLLTTLLESAGAERAVLVLIEDGIARVEAVGTADGDIDVMTALALNGDDRDAALPESLYHYAVRTGQVAVTDDASASPRFAHDAYVRERRTRSAMCVPINNQGRVMGAVYLENDQVPGAFSAGRAELVSLLAGQIAVSIENARLYRNLEKRVAERTARLESSNGFIREVFGRYMSDEVVDTLLAGREGLSLGGERRTVTLMFTDLRGFTALCERLSPEQAVRTLNNYLSIVTEIVQRHQGNIDNIMGDGLLVLFGAPLWREDDADRATACALELQLAMPDVNARNAADGLPALTMGIGVHTGEVVVGNIGSKQRAKYSVIGRNANIASRVEASAASGQIYVSAATVEATTGPLILGDRYTIRAKGIHEALAVYDLRGIEGRPELQLGSIDYRRLALTPPRTVTVRQIDGKTVSEESAVGALLAVGAQSMELRLPFDAPPGTDLVIESATTSVYVKVAEHGETTVAHITAGEPDKLRDDP